MKVNSEHTDGRTEIGWKGSGIGCTKLTSNLKKSREFAFPVRRTGLQLVLNNIEFTAKNILNL